MPNLIRTFVAVLLAPEVVDAVYRAETSLKEIAPGLKWVNASNFHLTVKFLGNIPEDRVPDVVEAVKGAAEGAEPFLLGLRGIGVFGNPDCPRVVWAGTDIGAEYLESLAGLVEDRLNAIGYPREDRAFKAHVTLARGRANAGKLPEAFTRALNRLKEEDFGQSLVDALVVMKSETGKSGSVYSQLQVVRLGANRSDK